MEFTRSIQLDAGYEEAVEQVKAALADQGFGVLTEIDLRATFRAKLDVEVEPQVILGACNPQLARRALEAEPRIGALLPCNVVVRVQDGRTIVDALDPRLIAEVPESEGLVEVAEEAGARIQAALDSLRGS